MKALTIKQPYAQLILEGRKKTEWRVWSTTYRGPLAIHAGLGVDREECERVGYDAKTLPRGAVLCTVEMYDCKELSDGWFAWKLRKVKKIRPVPMRGRLGLWDWDATPQKQLPLF